MRGEGRRREGIANLLAALNVTTGEVIGECKPNRDAENFLAFLTKAVKPHAEPGRDPVGILPRQSIRRDTSSSVNFLINRIRGYINF
ncbi:hypothetical protein NKH18_27125 [Streptomyces sp. M10(2022)]